MVVHCDASVRHGTLKVPLLCQCANNSHFLLHELRNGDMSMLVQFHCCSLTELEAAQYHGLWGSGCFVSHTRILYFIYTNVVYRLISPGSSHRMLLPRTVPWVWEPLREQPGNELCSCSVGGHWHQTLVQPPAGQSNTLASTYWWMWHGKQLSSSNGNIELIHSSYFHLALTNSSSHV